MSEEKLCAEMRLAFTRAAVQFPRLNMHPVSIAVYHVFCEVFHDLRIKHQSNIRPIDPYEQKLNSIMSALVVRAKEDLLPKHVIGILTAGMPPQQAKVVDQLIAGLNRAEARSLLMSIKSSNDVKGIGEKRVMMLRTHRNLAANRLVRDAMKEARKYFLGEDDDEHNSG